MSNLEEVDFAENPDPRCPCVLLLDTSGSMQGAPIRALNEGLQAFQRDIIQDELARKRVEIAIVTFGNGGVDVVQEFVTVDQFEPPPLRAGGNTPMGAAILVALDRLRERKQLYKENGIPYYRPWVFMITDGEPTDQWQEVAQSIRREEQEKGLAFFAVGVENANLDTLAQISVRRPMRLAGLKFTELFLWLSQSQKRVSTSKIGELTQLPAYDDWSVV